MAVEIVPCTGPGETHGIALSIQVHQAYVAFGRQLAHGFDAVAEVPGKGIGIADRDELQAHRWVGLEVMRGEWGPHIVLQPHQSGVEKHVAPEQQFENGAQALFLNAIT
ncbi:hypothetical protein [Pseudomonas corrugata]|uniref:hypothetical protein n=1 Tax=Pseudomonas corrugata TaxID=47879 RepID=UPI001F523770|nr:hypothetical protein [Pseudomonas corrugata]